MNKMNILLVCLSVLVLSLSAALMIMNSRQNQTFAQATAQSSSQTALYLLKTYQDKVGVFEPGAKEPKEVLDITVAALPEQDQQMLQKGIAVQSEQELKSLIEDFDG